MPDREKVQKLEELFKAKIQEWRLEILWEELMDGDKVKCSDKWARDFILKLQASVEGWPQGAGMKIPKDM